MSSGVERRQTMQGHVDYTIPEDLRPLFPIGAEFIRILLEITRVFLYPGFIFLHGFLSTFVPTFDEIKRGQTSSFTRTVIFLVYLVLFIVTLPLHIVFYPLRIILLSLRRPYQFSVKHSVLTDKFFETSRKSHSSESGNFSFSIASANILLPPEYISRTNHIKHVHLRSKTIGERIIVDQFFPQQQLISRNDGCGKQDADAEVTGGVAARFSSLDFVCIQEAFCRSYNKTLMGELHKVYPYIIHDVGVHSYRFNRFVLNSGLMVASRYPIVAVDFKTFSDFVWPAILISQGVVMAKVIVEPKGSGPKARGAKVGYVFNGHLQAYQGDERIIPKQLDEVLAWGEEFIRRTKAPEDEVLFQVMCGDFNSDNMSPCDRDFFHHQFFNFYEDFCREAPGKDKDWTVGTELRQKNMLDSCVASPEGLKTAMEDPCLRRQYIADANIETQSLETLVFQEPPTNSSGQVIASSLGGKRRIDLILFHSQYPVKVQSYDFVTRLASLTDHVPVQLSFSCPS